MKYITVIPIVAAVLAVGIMIVDAQYEEKSELEDYKSNLIETVLSSEGIDRLKRQATEICDQNDSQNDNPDDLHRSKRTIALINATLQNAEQDIAYILNLKLTEAERLYNATVASINTLFNAAFPSGK